MKRDLPGKSLNTQTQIQDDGLQMHTQTTCKCTTFKLFVHTCIRVLHLRNTFRQCILGYEYMNCFLKMYKFFFVKENDHNFH